LIDSPTDGALINVGDSLFVRVHLHSERVEVATMQVSARGGVDLGVLARVALRFAQRSERRRVPQA
jgi:hypothetical protein